MTEDRGPGTGSSRLLSSVLCLFPAFCLPSSAIRLLPQPSERAGHDIRHGVASGLIAGKLTDAVELAQVFYSNSNVSHDSPSGEDWGPQASVLYLLSSVSCCVAGHPIGSLRTRMATSSTVTAQPSLSSRLIWGTNSSSFRVIVSGSDADSRRVIRLGRL